jgi:exopolyphosphatase/pppGpp-phosphohydrolase
VSKSLQVFAAGPSVRFRTREWDGIDNPDYVAVENMPAAQARRFAANILQCSDEAEAAEATLKVKRKDEIVKQMAALQAELAVMSMKDDA